MMVYIFFLSLSSNHLWAQSLNAEPPKVNIPTSPEASLISRFGDIPVGYYTGTANVSIPFYTIKEGKVEIPIAISYHGSGIKVDDQATWVGLGWDLSPEGTIVQEVRGKADEDDNDLQCSTVANYSLFQQRFSSIQDNSYMFLNQWGRVTAPNACVSPNPYMISNPPPAAPYNNNYEDPYCALDQLSRGIGQPDMYNYNFGGYSGKFYIRPVTHEIVMIDRPQEIYFEKVNASLIKATTLDGTVYSFGIVETANAGIANEYTGKTYKVSNITLLNGKTIDFTYANSAYVERICSQSADIITFSGLPVSTSYPITNHNQKRLTKITTADAVIDFNADARSDINVFPSDNLQKLSSIDITARASNKKIKTIQFNYGYFAYNYTGVVSDTFVTAHADALGKRLRLDNIKEIGYDDNQVAITTQPPYQFLYDETVTMPMKISFAKDFWGYYNGESNRTSLPDLNYFDYFYKDDYKATNLTLAYPYAGANRYTNNLYAGAYMLKRMTYPTSGYTDFTYEPNSFANQFIPDKTKNVYKDYTAYDNSVNASATSTFKLSRATTIHFENSILNGKGNYNGVTPMTRDQMANCYIKFMKVKTVSGVPQTTLIKQWDLSTVLNTDFQNNGGKTWSEDLRVEFDADPDPTFGYQVKVDYPDNLNNTLYASTAGVTARCTFYDETGVDVSLSNQCGMRIKTIKSYTQSGVIASDKQINYYNGKLLNKFRPLSVYKSNSLDVSGVTNGTTYEYIAFFKRISVSGSDFGTAGGNLIGYGKVEEVELAQSVANHGKKVFNYNNTENLTQQGCPNIPNLRNGLISSEEVYDNLNTKLSDKTYTYSYLQPFPAKTVVITVVKLSFGSQVPCGNTYDPTAYTTQYYTETSGKYIGSQYGYNAYTINAEWSKLGTTTTNQYVNGNVLSSSETLTYNPQGSVSTVTSVNSKNDQLITRYYYPIDNLVDPTTDSYMTTKHNTGMPVITEQYKGSTLLSKQKVVYGNVSSSPTYMPQYLYAQTYSNTAIKTMTMDAYDSKGNVTQYTGLNGIPVAIVWNTDQTLPIAKVENATYASLLALPGGLTANFRTSLPNARVTTYTYKSLIGVSTITDPNNKTNYYEYDAFNRLALIRDQDNNILKKICYNYAGQVVDCGVSAPSACSEPGAVSVPYQNLANAVGYTVVLTNTSTNISYSYIMPAGSGTLGCVQPGTYNITISKPGGNTTYLFGCGANYITGTSASYANISMTTKIPTISIDYGY